MFGFVKATSHKYSVFKNFTLDTFISIKSKILSVLKCVQAYLRIVQEKVALSSPRVPHTSIRGGRIMPKEKAQTVKIISRMFTRE